MPTKKHNKWKRAFREQFSELPHKWEIVIVQDGQKQDSINDGMKNCQYKSKTKFECRRCMNRWTSSFAMVIFQFKLRQNKNGEVKLHLIGQQCKKCSSNIFERPFWSEKQISGAIEKLRQRVNEAYYGAVKAKTPRRGRSGEKDNTNGPHRPDLCEACMLGVCRKKRTITR